MFPITEKYIWTRTQNHLVLKRTLNHLATVDSCHSHVTLKRVRDMTRTYSQKNI